MNRAAQDLRTAEEWMVKYQVVASYIDNPVVIENAERAAQWVLDKAVTTRYTLAEVTAMFQEVLRWMWAADVRQREATQPSAAELTRRVREAAKGRTER